MTGVTAIVDDIFVFGKTRAEHDQNLRKNLTRAHERGIKLNVDKVKIGVTEVRYFGNILTQNGLKSMTKNSLQLDKWMLQRTDQS